MKKGKEKMGQLVARYGLLAALGLGSMSFVSGAPAPAAWNPTQRSVKFVNVGRGGGTAVEYEVKSTAPETVTTPGKVITKAEAGKLLQSWFKDEGTMSEGDADLTDELVIVAGSKVTLEGAKEALKIAKDMANGDAALTQRVDDLSQKTEWKDGEKQAFSQLCSDLQGKGSDEQRKKLSEALLKNVADSDLPKTEDMTRVGGNVVFELKDASQAANVAAAAIFNAADNNVVADFNGDGAKEINVMGEKAKALFKHVPFDMANIPAAANLAVQDQPVAQANGGLTSIAGAGNGAITGAITAMEATVKNVAAVWYADEILGATVDSQAMKGAIQRVKEAILVDGNKYQNKGYKLGALGGHVGIDNGNMSQWQDVSGSGDLWVTQQEAEETLNALEKLFTQAKNQAKAQHFFVDVDAVYELLDTVVQDADPQSTPNSNLDLVANAGLVAEAGYFPAPTNGNNFTTAIHGILTGPNGKLMGLGIQVECIKRLAELVGSELPKVGNNLANLAANQGKVHTDSNPAANGYKSVYDLLNTANGGLLSVTAGCTTAVGAAGAAMDTYKARKFVEDMRFASSFVDELGAHYLTGAPAIANYMPQQTVTDLNSIEAEVKQKHGIGGLFEVKFPANIAAGSRFCAVYYNELKDANPMAGDSVNNAFNNGAPNLAVSLDLSNDYNDNSGATPPNGNGVTVFVHDHPNADVVIPVYAVSGNYADENGAKVRHASSKNVTFGDIITGNPGDNGSTKVVLINQLTNSSQKVDERKDIKGEGRRAMVFKGAIKESATDSNWKTKATKIDLATAADGLNGDFWHEKLVNVRSLTLGVQAGESFRDDGTGKIIYAADAMSGGHNTFKEGLRIEEAIVANNGKSSLITVPEGKPFEVSEILSDKESSIDFEFNKRDLKPLSDKEHVFVAKNGAGVGVKQSEIELVPLVNGDKSRIYTFNVEGTGGLALDGTTIHLGEIATKVLNGVEVETSVPENLPGVVNINFGDESGVAQLSLADIGDRHAGLVLDSNKGVNGVRVNGAGTLEVFGDESDGQHAVTIKVGGTDKGNGLGYTFIAPETTVKLVRSDEGAKKDATGKLALEGNVLVKSFSIAKGTELEHKEGDMTVKDLTDVMGEFGGTGEFHLNDLAIRKDGRLEVADAKVFVDGNLTDGTGALAAEGSEITWKQDLALENNGEWKLAKVNATFEGSVGAKDSKVSFDNADDNKIEFKSGLVLGSGSNWELSGGGVAVGGGALVDSAEVSLTDCKTTVAGDFAVNSKGRLTLDGGSFDVDGKLSVSGAEVLSCAATTVKGLEVLNNGKVQHEGEDYTIDGDALFEGQFDASKNTQGKLKFVKDGFTATFKVTPVSDDGKQILLVMVSTASDDSVEGLEKAKEFRLLDQSYVEQFGSDQLLEVLADLAKKNTQIKLFDHIPDAITNDVLAKTNVDDAVMPGYQAVKGSQAISLANVTNPDDIRLLSRMYNGELDLKDLPAGVIKALAAKWRKGTKNGGAVTLTSNSDGTVSATGDIKAEALFNSTLDKIIGDDVKNAAKRIEAIGRSTAEENARGVIQLADSARHTAYNNLDKFLEPSAHYSIWASGFGDIARQKVCGYKVNYDIYGFEAGIDAALNNYWTLGLLGGYGKVNGKFKGEYKLSGANDYLDKCDTKSYFGGVYGMWSDFVQDLEVKFSLLAGHAKFGEKRNVQNPFTKKNTTDFGTKGFWISGNIDATYKHWDIIGIKLGPWASLSFTDIHQKEGTNPLFGKDDIKINDGKGQMNRVAEKYNRYAPELTVGVAADYDSPFGLLNLAMGYKRDFRKLSGGSVHLNTQILDAEGKVKDAYKADLGKNSNRSGRDSFVAQASYNMEYGPVGIALGIRGQVGDHFKDIAGSVSASYSF